MAITVLLSIPVLAQDARVERLRLDPTATEVSISSEIAGYESVNYVVDIVTAQPVAVVLESDNTSNYFNIFEPGKVPGEARALFIGSTEGNRFEGFFSAQGDYTIQVYIMRNAARRGDSARFTLALSFSSDAAADSASQSSVVAAPQESSEKIIATGRQNKH